MLLAAFHKEEEDARPRKSTWCEQSQVGKVSLIALKKWCFAFQQSLFFFFFTFIAEEASSAPRGLVHFFFLCSPLERHETKTVVQKLLFFLRQLCETVRLLLMQLCIQQ